MIYIHVCSGLSYDPSDSVQVDISGMVITELDGDPKVAADDTTYSQGHCVN